MKNLFVTTFEDLMQHGDCTIACAMSGTIVRTLTVQGDNCHLVAGDGTELDIPLATQITYDAWVMDRGSLLFMLGGQDLKICTELDVLTTTEGEQYAVQAPRS